MNTYGRSAGNGLPLASTPAKDIGTNDCTNPQVLTLGREGCQYDRMCFGCDHFAADRVQLDRATSEARRVISDAGRYRLVDVASAAGEGVKSRSLRQCNGCEAAIALKLGADQSFVGVVTRISRTEYVVRFQIRDARTGAPIIARQSDLRIGADYSWNRGAAALINSGLLDNR